MLKGQERVQQAEAKRQEDILRKQENKRLAEEEENQAMNAKKSKGVKLMKTELEKQSKKEAMLRGLQAETGGKKEEGYDSEEDLQQMIELNVDEMMQELGASEILQESGVNEAMGSLSLGDKHPERKMKMLYKVYVEEQMPIMKEEKKGLKRSQYLQMVY